MAYRDLTNDQLLRQCAGSADAEAWEELVRRFQPLVAAVIQRVADRWNQANSGVVDDLVQETFLKLCRNQSKAIKDFKATHENSVFGFMKTVAMNVAIDHFRTDHVQNEAVAIDSPAGKRDLFTDSTERKTLNSLLLQQIDAALLKVSTPQMQERDRMVFWLYYHQGYTAKAIADIPSVGLSVKGVETLLLRLTRAVREDLRSNENSSKENPR